MAKGVIRGRIKGADRLERRLRLMGKREMKLSIARATRATSKAIVTAIRPKLPVRTGRLKKGMKVLSIRRSSKYVGTRASITKPIGPEFYGFFLNFGWHPARHSRLTTKLPVTFTSLEGKKYRSDRRANRERGFERRLSQSVTISGKKTGLTGGVHFKNKALSGDYIPGKRWMAEEVRRKRSYYVRLTQRGILRALRAKGI